jgi:hypothetical protein
MLPKNGEDQVFLSNATGVMVQIILCQVGFFLPNNKVRHKPKKIKGLLSLTHHRQKGKR